MKIWLVLISFLGLLGINYYFGTQSILNAHQNQYWGGLCGACETCIEQTTICKETSGFDRNFLIISLFIVTFTLGIVNVFQNRTLVKSILLSIAVAFVYIFFFEFISQNFKIPVMSINADGSVSLYYGFLISFVHGLPYPQNYTQYFTNIFNQVYFYSFLSLIVGMIGNIGGVFVKAFTNKKYRAVLNKELKIVRSTIVGK